MYNNIRNLRYTMKLPPAVKFIIREVCARSIPAVAPCGVRKFLSNVSVT